MRQHTRWMTKLAWVLLGIGMSTAFGCSDSDAGDDGGADDAVVGSGDVTERIVPAMFVEHVTIDIPFRATVYSGDAQQIRIEGEDNLIALIDVEEVGERNGRWEITAPDIAFVQHDDIRIEIPFIEMVYISLRGASVKFSDEPAGVQDAGPPDDAGADDDAGG